MGRELHSHDLCRAEARFESESLYEGFVAQDTRVQRQREPQLHQPCCRKKRMCIPALAALDKGMLGWDETLTHSGLVLPVYQLIMMSEKHRSGLSTATRSSVLHIGSYDGLPAVWRAKLN